VVSTLYAEKAWGSSPLGRPIAGTVDSIRALTRAQIRRFYTSRYTADRMVVAVAGNVDHAEVVRLVEKAFARSDFLADADLRPAPVRRGDRARRTATGEVVVSRPFEQVNLVLGVNGLVRTDERRYALGILNAALGGGTSSRLFQEIREKRGLAYSVYSYASHYADAGMVGVAVGALPSKVADVLSVVREQLATIAEHGISADELRRGQGQLRGGLVLSLEDSGSRMSRIAKAELLYDDLPSIDEVLQRVAAVTVEDVNILARTLFTQPQTLAVVGPPDSVPERLPA
jgi:predicted Zn-dependent peptidase